MFLTQEVSGAGRSEIDDFWYTPIGLMSTAGAQVSPELAQKLTVVFACNKVIAETVGQLPLHLYRRRSDGGRDMATKHPLYNILHTQPNRWQTAIEFREMMQGHATMRGNAYAEMFFKGGYVSELIPLHPDRVKPELVDARTIRYVYDDPFLGRERIINAGGMFHLKGFGSNGYTGLNPIEFEREAVGMGLAMQDYGARFYKNNAQPGGWLEYEGHFEDLEAKRKFRSDWEAMHSGTNQHRVAILEYGMKYHELGVRNRDAQFLESRKYTDVEIARIFRVPPHKIGILDKATFSNIEQQSLEFVTDTMMPWLVRWEQAISRDILLDDEDMFAKFQVQGLLRGDAAARSTYYKEGVINGWFTRNEVRQWEDLNPIEGLDTPLQQMNMGSTQDNSTSDDTDQDTTQQPEQDTGTNRGRMHAVMRNAAQRIVNKELLCLRKAHKKALSQSADVAKSTLDEAIAALFDDKHADLVVNSLACSVFSAQNYLKDCRTQLQHALASEMAGVPAFEMLFEVWEKSKADEMIGME